MTIKSIKEKYKNYSYKNLMAEIDTINDSILYLKEKINTLTDSKKDGIYLKSYNLEIKEFEKVKQILIKFVSSAI